MNKLIRDIAVFSSTLSRAAKSVTIISYSESMTSQAQLV